LVAKTVKHGYTTVSVKPDVAQKIDKVQGDFSLRNKSEAVEVLLAAYDILNGTGYGGPFSEAVKTAFNDGRGDD